MSTMMNERSRPANFEWVVIGAIVAILGAILLLDRAGLVRVAGGWNLWPLLLIGLGISRMLGSRGDGCRHGGFLAFVGFWLLLGRSWPLLLIAVGVTMIWKAVAARTPPAARTE